MKKIMQERGDLLFWFSFKMIMLPQLMLSTNIPFSFVYLILSDLRNLCAVGPMYQTI